MRDDGGIFGYALRSIAAAANYQQLTAFLYELRRLYGFSHIAYHAAHVPAIEGRGALVLSTYEPEWVKRYVGCDYFRIDPVEIAWQRAIVPIDWADLDRSSSKVKAFFIEADRFEVGRQGLSIPILGGALFTFTAHVGNEEWPGFCRSRKAEMGMLGQYLHHRVLEFASPIPTLLTALSERELQCVRFLSLGYAPKQVAGAMGISQTTVREYTKAACCKLQCASARELVPKAIALGLVDLMTLQFPRGNFTVNTAVIAGLLDTAKASAETHFDPSLSPMSSGTHERCLDTQS